MDDKISVWVVDDDRSIRWVVETALKKTGHIVTCFPAADGVVEMMEKETPDVLITDIRMPGKDGIVLLQELQAHYPDLPVIVMTAHSDMDSAVSAYDSGAFEYLPKPFDIDDLLSQVERAYIQSKTALSKGEVPSMGTNSSGIIGVAPSMQVVFRAIGKLSRSNVTVMINGESGTGKELVAKALHQHSPRADNAFIALNMAAIPKDLIESELFGHEKGAFTGALSQRKGRFEQANGGTLFLDEIGDMPSDMQTRLLRVLSDGEFYKVGGHEPVKVDVRIVTATHQGLEGLVKEGLFREDLFHRLNVVRIVVPPLRDRREDIPLLLNYFLSRAAKELSVDIKQLHGSTLDYLKNQTWQGNVREIENLCRWLTVMCPTKEIQLKDLPAELLEKEEEIRVGGDWLTLVKKDIADMLQRGDTDVAKKMVSALEKILIYEALEFTNGRRQDAAQHLGWGRNTLTRKIKELGA